MLIITGIKLFFEKKKNKTKHRKADRNFLLPRCVQRFWINKCDKHLALSPPHLSFHPPLLLFSLAHCLSSCVIPSTFFGKRAARRFNSSQRMCGVGSFQHGSGSTKNSTAGLCQTILVPDVSANGEREREKGGKQI